MQNVIIHLPSASAVWMKHEGLAGGHVIIIIVRKLGSLEISTRMETWNFEFKHMIVVERIWQNDGTSWTIASSRICSNTDNINSLPEDCSFSRRENCSVQVSTVLGWTFWYHASASWSSIAHMHTCSSFCLAVLLLFILSAGFTVHSNSPSYCILLRFALVHWSLSLALYETIVYV